MSAASETLNAVKKNFKNESYPQIRVIVLPDIAHLILQGCPLVREVTINKGGGQQILSSARNHCPHIAIMHRVQGDGRTLKALVEAVPDLRKLQITENSHKLWSPAALRPLFSLPHLSTVILGFTGTWTGPEDPPDFLYDDSIRAYIRTALDIFRDDLSPHPMAR
ncbi:hypothetical protein OBBRIDRAFT_824606 [Obba rivulosa]|uniref:Uncharacterized protein n=1 Tax=Obba rivulosa TaxID=1052685 RepID=A0A8E2AY05_9APHY|nr:hypothetical protein OBBRIDRAFT_824606 [Obba rivulosa]